MIAFNITLRPHVLCDDVRHVFHDLSIQKLDFIGSCVEDGVFVCQSSKFSIGVSLPSLDLAYQDGDGEGQPRAPDIEDVTPEAYDLYLNTEVLLPRGDGLRTRFVGRGFEVIVWEIY